MTTLYTKDLILCKLNEQISQLFSNQTKPTKEHLTELFLSNFALNGCHSVKFNYEHFIKENSKFSLNSFYFALSQAKINLDDWTAELLRIALKIQDFHSSTQPIILSIDDTLVEKYGTEFEACSKLFDHAFHNGSNYLNGHCFVCLMLHLPIQIENQKQYISLPIAYRMWDKKKTKLQIAADLVKQVMKELGSSRSVVLCCDSWYPKAEVANLVDEFKNLTLICNVRCDTVLYDFPQEPTGKRGRPQVHGKRISLEDFTLQDIPDANFSVGTRSVKTKLFGHKTVYALVTSSKKIASKRLFICSRNPNELSFDEEYFNKRQADLYSKTEKKFLPLSIYTLRWDIEVSFYEMKNFWSLSEYKVRSKEATERLINLLSIGYALMILLPCNGKDFSAMKEQSPQQLRFICGQRIQYGRIIAQLESLTETHKNSYDLVTFLQTQLFSKKLPA